MPCPRHAVISCLHLSPFLNDAKSVALFKKVAVVAVTGVCLHLAVKAYLRRARENRRKQYKKDVVILHQRQRATTCPSLSPFALKLETYLKIAKIPYECDFDEPMGPKGKTPWITYNGVDVADSAFCIEYLNKQFSIDLHPKLTPEDVAISRFMIMTAENNFVFCFAMWRCLYDKEMAIFKLTQVPVFLKIFPFVIRRYVKKLCYYQGIGRHSEQEVYDIGIKDLKAFSSYLGKKRYFMGDDVSEVDCALFGILAQCVWGLPNSPFEAVVNGELKNLKEFCLRMKHEFWKDWDSVLLRK